MATQFDKHSGGAKSIKPVMVVSALMDIFENRNMLKVWTIQRIEIMDIMR